MPARGPPRRRPERAERAPASCNTRVDTGPGVLSVRAVPEWQVAQAWALNTPRPRRAAAGGMPGGELLRGEREEAGAAEGAADIVLEVLDLVEIGGPVDVPVAEAGAAP